MALADWMASLNLSVLNHGAKPSFSRVTEGGVSESYIDVSMASESLCSSIGDWSVMGEYTGSLHRYISFVLSAVQHRESYDARWSWGRLDRQKLLQPMPLTLAASRSPPQKS